MKKETGNKSQPSTVDRSKIDLFEQTFLPHLNAAYNLARWLTRNDQDAEDVVQESYVRALHSFGSFQHGRDARPWLLKIVRNTCCTWLQENRSAKSIALDDEAFQETASMDPGPEAALLQNADALVVRQALEDVQFEYREVLVLREFEGLSYKEIAESLGIPMGTVMSRLSRGREDLFRRLRARLQGAKP